MQSASDEGAVNLPLSRSVVREWRAADLSALVRHANDRSVWMHLRDRFPHPYLEEDGRVFLDHLAKQNPSRVWAIEVEGEAVGGVGIELFGDVERVSGEIGYWLGQAHWGRGVMSEVVRAVTTEAFRLFGLTRIFALPFADNLGSIRVLEKAGYSLEGRMPQSAIKEGRIRDQLMFGAYRQLR
jgi:[ribosomal protein S5]-alanine N-acetyltransferase